MNLIVCLKQILDPEIPVRDFKVDPVAKEAVRGSANLVTNIFCENALETALQFKEKAGAGKITALCFAPESGEDTLRKAMAMKADEAVLVLNDGVANPDPLLVARTLAAAIRKIGSFDVVMVGRESGDWGVGQTGGLVAEELGVPYVGFVDTIEANGKGVKLKRQTDSGYEIVEASTPIVISITNDEHNVPRVPKTRDVMMSFRQPLTKWTLSDLGASTSESYYEVAELGIPVKESSCEFVTGDTLEERVAQLAERILAVKRSL
ncbi:MAG TPA: electron transfer flavoprotein subunit beta/FixA family protein [Blastocatellia bacterium]|nr:electron transfer flavoprotein subunit beta/FixA family protein [Blastocatellia bacterium]